jgi:hypothetical protein
MPDRTKARVASSSFDYGFSTYLRHQRNSSSRTVAVRTTRRGSPTRDAEKAGVDGFAFQMDTKHMSTDDLTDEFELR